MFGREVLRPADDIFGAGRHEARFDAADLAAGVYRAELRAGGVRAERMIVVVK